MALDPSIFAQYLRPPKSVADFDREAYDTERARLGSASAQLELLAGQRQFADQEAKRGAYAQLQALQRSFKPGMSLADRATAFEQAGNWDQADTLRKADLDQQETRGKIAKESATAAKTFGEAQDASLKRYRGMLDFIDTPQGAVRWMQAQYADPELGQYMLSLGPLEQALQRIPQDPAGFQQWRQQAGMGMDKYMEQQRLQAAQAETARHNAASEGLTRRGQDVSSATARRGQDLVNAREAEKTAQGKWQYDSERGGLVNMQTGEFRPATQGGTPIGAKDKPLNDSQAKALLFGSRMQEAERVLAKMAKEGVERPGTLKGLAEGTGNLLGLGTESAGGALSNIAGRATNWTQSKEQQSVEQAQRDFINAVLRRESGASISPAEFRNAEIQYFPQAGDSDAVKAQKARNRQTAIAGMMAEVPENKRTLPGAQGASADPTVDDLLKKYGQQ